MSDSAGISVNSTSIRIAAHREIYVSSDYPSIQAAIDAALDGDRIIVADGTYTGEGNKNLDLKEKAITVRSENGPDNCIIDCENDGRGFYLHGGEEGGPVISGFSIKNGLADCGGGIYCINGSPTISNCIIIGNAETYAGGGGV